jgi:inner membrane protein
MASIGHLAIGVAAARVSAGRKPSWRAMAAWSALSMLPDTDVVGFALGVPYSAPWGHRGATHSLTAAVGGGVLAAIAARATRRPALRAGAIAFAVLASHGLLDTLTDGGLGAALLWPFDLTRYFAPWQPIPVAPIGFDFVSTYGLIVSLIELVLFAPVLVWALRPRPMIAATPAMAGVALWLAAVWLIESTDPLRQAVISRLLREDTAYSNGFSEAAFRTVAPGQAEADVRRRLGPPREEGWYYFDGHAMEMSAAGEFAGCQAIRFENGVAAETMRADACQARGVSPGLTADAVGRRLGPPPEACLYYTWSPSRSHFRQRTICVLNGTVSLVAGRWQ